MPRNFQDALPKFYDVRVSITGIVPHVDRDICGRIIRAYGRIPSNLKVQGSDISGSIKEDLREKKVNGDNFVQIIPRCIGGSGYEPDNVYLTNLKSVESLLEKYSEWLEDEKHFIVFEFFYGYSGNSYHPNQSIYAIDECYIDENDKVQIKNKERIGDSDSLSLFTSQEEGSNDNAEVCSGNKATTSAVTKGLIYTGKSFYSATNAAGISGKAIGAATKNKTILFPVAVGLDIYRIGSAAVYGDGNDVVKTTAKIGGEWGGGWIGATTGAAIGTSMLPFGGTFVGGIIGGVVGALSGGFAAESVAEVIVD